MFELQLKSTRGHGIKTRSWVSTT